MKRLLLFGIVSVCSLSILSTTSQIALAEDFSGYCNAQANQTCTRDSLCDDLDPSDPTSGAECDDRVTACAEVEADDCIAACTTSPSSCQPATTTPPATAPTDGGTARAAAAAPPAAVTLPNPLGVNDPRLFIGRLIQAIISLSGAIALVMFVYAGLMFLTAGGNTGQIDKAKHLMLYVILGIVVIAGAFVATNTIFTAVLTGDPVVGQGDN